MEPIFYDVFVIGSGTAGQTVATQCAKSGMKVAISDNREYGGTCANRGCDPKKIFLTFGELADKSRNLKGLGIKGAPEFEWSDILAFKQSFTEKIPLATEDKLKELGIDLYHQSPRFLNEKTIEVEGKQIEAAKYVIASGNKPRELEIPGKEHLLTSDDFLELKELPKSAVFIGGGYIAMEFAHLLAALGCNVDILEKSDCILAPFDGDMVKVLMKRSEEMDIKFHFDVEVLNITDLRKNKRVTFQIGSEEHTLDAECIFNTSGRVPSIDMLNLERAGVLHSGNGVKVNDFLQNPGNHEVYACGDVSDFSKPLTPLSGLESNVVAQNIIEGNTKKLEAPIVPSVVFTNPNLASVGMDEEEAKNRYKNIRIAQGDVSDWYSAKRLNESAYAYKLIFNERTDELVGAHLIGPTAAETINLLTLAIHQKMTGSEIKSLLFTYPSHGNDILHMVD